MDINERFALWEKKYKPHGEHEELLYIIAKDAVAALSSPHPEAREEGDLAADEARVWQALNVGKGMAEALKLSGDSYSAGDWEDTKAGYGRLLESFRSRLVAPKPEGQDCNKLQSDIATEPRPADEPFATSKDSLQVEPASATIEEVIQASEVKKAMAYNGRAVCDWKGARDTLAAEVATLRSQLARKDEEAELYRRQYDELSAWWRGERPDEEYVGKGHPLEERHARERASLREPDGRKGE